MKGFQIAIISGNKSAKGWHVHVNMEDATENLLTLEERASLLEKIACTASANAAAIRQRISAGTEE